MPHAIRLYHPGGERRLHGRQNVQSGRIPWATEAEKHARKFLSATGRYLKTANGDVFDGNIMFWGEWEPPSKFTRLENEGAGEEGLPHRIHTPLIETAVTTSHVLNTDPYVFGKRFYYSCCLQDTYETLRTLEPQSLILFGAYKKNPPDDGKFYLDTVFVVDRTLARVADVRRDNELLTDTAYEAIIAPYEGHVEVANSQLYSGVMHRESCDYFSYFPCSSGNQGRLFARIPVSFTSGELQHLGLSWSDKQMQGYSGKLPVTHEFARQVWQAVTARVLASDLFLGVYAEEPVLQQREAR